MSYTIVTVNEVDNWFEQKGWAGEMRFLTAPLGASQVAITYRSMPQHSGGKGGYGHKHKTQEEVIYLLKGTIELKLDDQVVDLHAGQAVRIAPEVVRSIWNDKKEPAEVLIISTKIDDLDADTIIVKDFWPTKNTP